MRPPNSRKGSRGPSTPHQIRVGESDAPLRMTVQFESTAFSQDDMGEESGKTYWNRQVRFLVAQAVFFANQQPFVPAWRSNQQSDPGRVGRQSEC